MFNWARFQCYGKGHHAVSIDDCVGWLQDDLLAGIICSKPKGAEYRLIEHLTALIGEDVNNELQATLLAR